VSRTKSEIKVPGIPEPKMPYSHAIVSGPFVFVSGQGPRDHTTGQIPTGIDAQIHQALRNLKSTLEAAGSELDAVVKVTGYLADLKERDTFNAIYREYFSSPYPARTTIECGLGGILVEVDAIALVLPLEQ
jgi:2-iminobutanoate/2-iminopropanoate deaminase